MLVDARSYGTPSLKVCGKFVARLREDGETVALRVDVLERQERMAADPAAFFITDHYADYPAVVVRLAKVKRRDLAELIEAAWRDQDFGAGGNELAASRGGKAMSRRSASE